ncbi:hypothetical protein LIA77_00389 [Sarocladium implicatum]|nr:hypothetical protein LIA77_00389 [Sarocladium implicatum]
MSRARRTSTVATPVRRAQSAKLSNDGPGPLALRKSGKDVRLGPAGSKRAIRDSNWRNRDSECSTDPEAAKTRHADGEWCGTTGLGHWQHATTSLKVSEAQAHCKENNEQRRTTDDKDGSGALHWTSTSPAPITTSQLRATTTRQVNGGSTPFTFAPHSIAAVKSAIQIPRFTTLNNVKAMSLLTLQPVPVKDGAAHSNDTDIDEPDSVFVRILRVPEPCKNLECSRHGQGGHGQSLKKTDPSLTEGHGTSRAEKPQIDAHHGHDDQGGQIVGGKTPKNSEVLTSENDAVIRNIPADFRTAFPQRASEPPHDQFAPQDPNFQKILLKLNRGSRSDPLQSNLMQTSTEDRKRSLLASQDTQIHWQQSIQDENRRGNPWNNSGDSGYASLTSHRNSDQRGTSDTVIESEAVSKTGKNHFNPRARDFLSLAGNSTSTEDIGQSMYSLQLPSQENSGMPSTRMLPPTALPSLSQQWPSFPATSPLYGGWSWSDNLGITGNLAAGFGACPQEFLMPSLPPYAGTLMPLFQPTAHTTNGQAQSLLPVIPIPYPVPCQHQVAKPTSSTPTQGLQSVPLPPRPVPKPRAPNAAEQLRYEAYVEMCKATMPGYALECKMRQQTRAQRKLKKSRKGVDAATGVDPAQAEPQ